MRTSEMDDQGRRPGTTVAVTVGLSAIFGASVLVQVWLLPAAVARAVALFPEAVPLAAPALVWGVCAIACWQAVAVGGLRLVHLPRTPQAEASTRRWVFGVIGCLLAFVVLDGLAFTRLNEAGFTPPGLMLGLIASGLISLIAAAALALFLASGPSLRVAIRR